MASLTTLLQTKYDGIAAGETNLEKGTIYTFILPTIIAQTSNVTYVGNHLQTVQHF